MTTYTLETNDFIVLANKTARFSTVRGPTSESHYFREIRPPADDPILYVYNRYVPMTTSLGWMEDQRNTTQYDAIRRNTRIQI